LMSGQIERSFALKKAGAPGIILSAPHGPILVLLLKLNIR
jgi:hypothetical protein